MELEAFAALFAKDMGCMNVHFEGDSITIMTTPFGNPIQDAKALATSFLSDTNFLIP